MAPYSTRLHDGPGLCRKPDRVSTAEIGFVHPATAGQSEQRRKAYS
jgi:hypothetical protein